MQQAIRRVAVLISLVGVFTLGVMSSRLVWQPISSMGKLFRNPLSLVTQITPSVPVVLERVQRLNRLESCRYNGEVIIRGDHSGTLPAWLVGDRILFIGRGEVVAGVDLSQLRAEDVQVQADHVSLRLPTAEILSTRLDNQHSEVYERRTGFLSQPNKDLETQARTEAENRLQEAALAKGVLQTANENAQESLRGQLRLLGFQDVKFL